MTEPLVSPPLHRTGHVIVCGLHDEGLRTVEQLHFAGVPVVVADDRPDPRYVRAIAAWNIPLVDGDPRLPETLLEAGLGGAIAVVCVESEDLATLEIALLARDLRADVRVVVQMRNPAVGRAIATSGVAVLDVAGLTAPSIVEACLQTGLHDLDIAGERFVAATVTNRRRGTLRGIYEGLAPIAVLPASGADMVVCPGRDVRVVPGDVVTVLGTASDLAEMDIEVDVRRLWGGATQPGAELDPAPAMPTLLGLHPLTAIAAAAAWAAHLVRTVAQTWDRRIFLVLGCLLGLVVISSTVLRFGYQEPDGDGMNVVDAVYFSVETIATVGYGDFNFRSEPTWLRLYAIGLMILGATLATVLFALLTNMLVTLRIEESLGRLRTTRLSGHVVVVGLGSIGIRVVELLVGHGYEVVVIEPNPQNRYLAHARRLRAAVVTGSATSPDVLRTVHLSHARAVAVLTSDDLVNFEAGLAVLDQLGERRARVPVVLRIFDRHLARTMENGFGFASVRSTSALAAPWFVGAALGLTVLGTFIVGDLPMLVASMRVAEGGGLDGRAMRDLGARTRVIAISRRDGDTLEHPPRRDTRFAAGDVAHLVGPYEELLQLLRTDAEGAARDSVGDGT